MVLVSCVWVRNVPSMIDVSASWVLGTEAGHFGRSDMMGMNEM
jgi:hypothetical protein